MMKDFSALSFTEKERLCNEAFVNNGPYWHICTNGTIMQNIFCSKEDFNRGMWLLAIAKCLTPKVKLLTFELMGNHVHLIVAGKKEDCEEFFRLFASRLKNIFTRLGKVLDWSKFQYEILPIESLAALRNEIIYTNRNAYVANPNYTPFSYLWGGGCAYFNPFLEYLPIKPFSTLPILKQRQFTHSRDVAHFSGLYMWEDIVFIPSFCDIALGESMFQDARKYFNSLTRNAEAFSQIANRLKDSMFLTDDELYAVTIAHIDKEYKRSQIKLLSPEQKIDTARHLRFKYNATNNQIRRILKIEISLLEEMFPTGL